MKTLSFVIPVYNEEARLEKTFQALRELQLPRGLKLEKVIFVDDGSSDASHYMLDMTKSALRHSMKKHVGAVSIEVISYEENRGKGHAIATGMKASSSDYTLFTDADMSTPFDQLKRFVPHIEKGTDIIIGTRKNGHSTVIKHQPRYRELLGRCFTLLSQLILNTWVTDFTCGFKAFSKEAKDAILKVRRVNGWGYDSEFIFLGRIMDYSMVEVPVLWSNDARSKVNLMKDLPRSLYDLLKIRFSHASGYYHVRASIIEPLLRYV